MNSPEKKTFSLRDARWIVAVGIIAGLAIGAAGTWLLAERIDWFATEVISPGTENVSSHNEVTRGDANDVPSEDVVTPPTPELSPSVWEAYAKARTFGSSEEAPGDVSVEWIEAQSVASSAWGEIFGGVATPEAIKKFSTPVDYENTTEPDEYSQERVWMDAVWKVGRVKEGSYQNGTVYAAELNASYPFFSNGFFTFVLSEDGSEIVLARDSDGGDQGIADLKTVLESDLGLLISKSVILKGAFSPKKITVNDQSFVMTTLREAGYVYSAYSVFNGNRNALQYVVTSKEGMDLYQLVSENGENEEVYGGNGCLYAFTADGSWAQYGAFLPQYISASNSIQTQTWTEPRSPNILWEKGFENSNTYYGVVMTGCGASACANIVKLSAEEEANLVQVGIERKTKDSVYAPKDYVSLDITKRMYDTWYVPSGDKPSIEEMVSEYAVPFFFWKDAVGRWNRYTVSDLIPPVECGKPVIYLYPETQTDVRVGLPKFINVTVSDPAYPEKGWSVTANPNGDLLSHADGKTYGSLFWEGTGVGYQVPETGFIVKNGEAESFLSSILPKYGLNQKESQEFMEFWVPKMQQAPYYRVSFLTDDWSKAAPLFVSPRPKTSIRIFMDLKPLSAPISIKAPNIVTPARDGFTLVEWGGLLY